MRISEEELQRRAAYQDRGSALSMALLAEMHRARRFKRPLSIAAMRASADIPDDPNSSAQLVSLIERRVKRVAANVFELSDFWGRSPKGGLVIVLPEADLKSAKIAIARMTKSPGFQEFAATLRGRPARIRFGVVEWSAEYADADALIDAVITQAQ